MATGHRTGKLLSRGKHRLVTLALGHCLGTRCFEGDRAGVLFHCPLLEGSRRETSREQEVGNVREAETDEDRVGASFPPVQPGPRKRAEGPEVAPWENLADRGSLAPAAEVASDSGRERVSATLVPWSARGAQNGTRRLSNSSALGRGRPKSPMQQHLQRCDN